MASGVSGDEGSGGEEAASASLLDTLQALLHELPGLISDRVELFALELARAGRALARIVAWLVAIGISTFRVPAAEVLRDLEGVVRGIVTEAHSRLPFHHPSSPGGPPPRDKLGEE